MGHRVLGHEGKCANAHGHRFVAEVTVTADKLDGIGRVIDYGAIKDKVGGWIDANWDHGFMVWGNDAQLIAALQSVEPNKTIVVGFNPTSENIAANLKASVVPSCLAGLGMKVSRVRVYETPNCYAEATDGVSDQ